MQLQKLEILNKCILALYVTFITFEKIFPWLIFMMPLRDGVGLKTICLQALSIVEQATNTWREIWGIRISIGLYDTADITDCHLLMMYNCTYSIFVTIYWLNVSWAGPTYTQKWQGFFFTLIHWNSSRLWTSTYAKNYFQADNVGH